MSVLIITMPGDYHAHAVQWAIRQLGGDCEMLYPLDLADGACWSWAPGDDVLTIEYRGRIQQLNLRSAESVWMRRPPGLLPQESLADEHERSVSESEFQVLASSIFQLLGHNRLACNPVASNNAASMKPFQFAAAERVGLNMPKTLISNSPREVREFFLACGKRMIYKPIRAAVWVRDQVNIVIVPTTIIDDVGILDTCNLTASPGIFQELISKRVEVRATVIGRNVFAWEKTFESRDPTTLDVDWRWMNRDAVHKRHCLPDEITNRCFAIMKELDLVFGCFDFVIDESRTYYFLEVNPQGQWLWGDGLDIGLNQLECMAEFLMSGDPSFHYSGRNRVRFSDVTEAELQAVMAEEAREHHGNVMSFNYDRVSRKYFAEWSLANNSAA